MCLIQACCGKSHSWSPYVLATIANQNIRLYGKLLLQKVPNRTDAGQILRHVQSHGSNRKNRMFHTVTQLLATAPKPKIAGDLN